MAVNSVGGIFSFFFFTLRVKSEKVTRFSVSRLYNATLLAQVDTAALRFSNRLHLRGTLVRSGSRFQPTSGASQKKETAKNDAPLVA